MLMSATSRASARSARAFSKAGGWPTPRAMATFAPDGITAAATAGLSISPGATAFTVMPRGAHSSDSARTAPTSPALAAA